MIGRRENKMKDYYLQQLGINTDDCYWNSMPDDGRQNMWKKEQEKYGFDSRETWSLDCTFVHWFYPRLKRYLEVANTCVDLEFHKFEFKGNIYTQKQAVEKVLIGFEKYLIGSDDNEKINDSFELCGIIMRSLWW